MGVLGNRTAFHMIFDCQLSRGRARAPGCQRCFEAVLIRTAIRFSSTAAALPSYASSMHQDTPSDEVAALALAHGTGRTCLYRSAGDARLAGRLRARAQGSSCGGDDWQREINYQCRLVVAWSPCATLWLFINPRNTDQEDGQRLWWPPLPKSLANSQAWLTILPNCPALQ